MCLQVTQTRSGCQEMQRRRPSSSSITTGGRIPRGITTSCSSPLWCVVQTVFFKHDTGLSCFPALRILKVIGSSFSEQAIMFRACKHEFLFGMEILGFLFTVLVLRPTPIMAWINKITVAFFYIFNSQNLDLEIFVWILNFSIFPIQAATKRYPAPLLPNFHRQVDTVDSLAFWSDQFLTWLWFLWIFKSILATYQQCVPACFLLSNLPRFMYERFLYFFLYFITYF